MASNTASTLTRYRPALIATAAAVALAATYYLSNASPRQPTTLHRSNAVRRQRPRHDVHNATTSQEGEEADQATDRRPSQLQEYLQQVDTEQLQYGVISLDNVEIPLSFAQVPNMELLDSGRYSEEQRREVIVMAHVELISRFLSQLQALGPLAAPGDTRILAQWFSERGVLPDAISRWLRSFSEQSIPNASLIDTSDPPPGALQDNDDRETVAGTEISIAVTDSYHELASSEDAQLLTRAVYYIAEDKHRQEGVVHRGITCDQCDTRPIRGVRWRCANCADFDLCSACEADSRHDKTHVFYKIKVPAPFFGYPRVPQTPPYPGKPEMMPAIIPSQLKKDILEAVNIGQEGIDGFWDQFTCLANVPWPADPRKVGWAIDRKAFDKTFIPHYAKSEPAPNLIYDRVFSFYDSDGNGLIGFEEFIRGLDLMHSTDSKVRRKIAFQGYDIDDDGYVSRRDFLRLFRATYAIQHESTRDYIGVQTEILSTAGALDVIQSRQPLNSNFHDNPIGHGVRQRRPIGKEFDEWNDPKYLPNGVIRDGTRRLMRRNDFLQRTAEYGRRDATSDSAEDEMRTTAPTERWRRRQFYTDEEEGLVQPADFDAHEDIGDLNAGDIGVGEGVDEPANETAEGSGILGPSRGSRSSSRVRFQDDIELETRSNASTSSRPTGERWGGYDIPEAEKDFGKDLLFQITQQGFNELLDPLFLAKENLAIEFAATRDERRIWGRIILKQMEIQDSEEGRAQAKMIHHAYILRLNRGATLSLDHDYSTLLWSYAMSHTKDYEQAEIEDAYCSFLDHICDVDKKLLDDYTAQLDAPIKNETTMDYNDSPSEEELEDERAKAICYTWIKLAKVYFPDAEWEDPPSRRPSKMRKQKEKEVQVNKNGAGLDSENGSAQQGVRMSPAELTRTDTRTRIGSTSSQHQLPANELTWDPTMPQFRPVNSSVESENNLSERSETNEERTQNTDSQSTHPDTDVMVDPLLLQASSVEATVQSPNDHILSGPSVVQLPDPLEFPRALNHEGPSSSSSSLFVPEAEAVEVPLPGNPIINGASEDTGVEPSEVTFAAPSSDTYQHRVPTQEEFQLQEIQVLFERLNDTGGNLTDITDSPLGAMLAQALAQTSSHLSGERHGETRTVETGALASTSEAPSTYIPCSAQGRPLSVPGDPWDLRPAYREQTLEHEYYMKAAAQYKEQIVAVRSENGPIPASSKMPMQDEDVMQTAHRSKRLNPPHYIRLERLCRLQRYEKEARQRGGPGRISYEEFEAAVTGLADQLHNKRSKSGSGTPLTFGENLAFVENWLECVGF
jgi:hypothetical protein